MVFTGHLAAHNPQLRRSAETMHRFFMKIADPVLILFLSDTVSSLIAPDGHTEPHLVQSGRQKPAVKSIFGSKIPKMPYSRNPGCKTRVGQTLTQRWQAVQYSVK
jgi:hypothetical protein